MKNLTLAVHDDFLDRVRVIAAERKTTVNGLVREYLGKLANEEARLADTRKRLRELMDNSTAELGGRLCLGSRGNLRRSNVSSTRTS